MSEGEAVLPKTYHKCHNSLWFPIIPYHKYHYMSEMSDGFSLLLAKFTYYQNMKEITNITMEMHSDVFIFRKKMTMSELQRFWLLYREL